MWFIKVFAFHIINIWDYMTRLFTDPNYYLYRSMLLYKYDGSPPDGELTGFWKHESGWWESDNQDDWNVVELGRNTINVPTPPDCVSNCFYKYKFSWGGKVYKMMTRDQRDWPPSWLDKPAPLSFSWPIVRVELIGCDDNVVQDVTHQWKRYSGPWGDFFKCKNVKLNDIFTRDDYTSIRVINLLNKQIEYDPETYVDTLEAK